MRTKLLLVICAGLVGNTFAGQDEVDAARGMGFALVVVEKCTGIAPPADYVPRIRAGVTRSGMNDEDFRQGFASGAMQAEMRYQGKPPAKECREAKVMKANLDKTFL